MKRKREQAEEEEQEEDGIIGMDVSGEIAPGMPGMVPGMMA